MDFFDAFNWPIVLLIGLAIFPRITLLVGAILDVFITGGLLWWLGFIFAPHLLVAFLAIPFWDTNPVLVICAWILALTGTSSEVRTANRKRHHER